MTLPTMLVVAFLAWSSTAVRAERTRPTTEPPAATIQQLQGKWQGVIVGRESAGTISVTFSGNTLRYLGEGLQYDAWSGPVARPRLSAAAGVNSVVRCDRRGHTTSAVE